MKLLVAFVIVSLGLIGSSAFAATCDYNGCTYATAEVGVSEITFNSSGYFPSCIRVAAGDTVMFTGPFATYSLSNGYVADGTGNEVAVDNDLFNVTTGTTKNFTLTTLGLSAFFSPGNPDLKGVIYVGTTCDPNPPVAPVAPPTTPVAAPTTPVAAPSTPTAAPSTPTAAPTTAPVTSPTAQSPVAAPTTPSATPDAGTPVAAPVDSNSPSSAPVADTPLDQSPSASSPVDEPSASAPRPKRVRVSSAAQVVSGIAVFAAIGVAML